MEEWPPEPVNTYSKTVPDRIQGNLPALLWFISFHAAQGFPDWRLAPQGTRGLVKGVTAAASSQEDINHHR